MSDVAFIKAGTIDDTSWLAPTVHIYCDSRQSWIPIPEGNRQFPKNPRRGPGARAHVMTAGTFREAAGQTPAQYRRSVGLIAAEPAARNDNS
jgi:hypothetical protein